MYLIDKATSVRTNKFPVGFLFFPFAPVDFRFLFIPFAPVDFVEKRFLFIP